MTNADNRPYPKMPGDDEYGKSLHMLVGELSGTVTALAKQVGNMSQAIEAQVKSFSRVESAQRATADDVRRLRSEVVTPEFLRNLGIRPEEAHFMRRDFEWLRTQRVAADARKPIVGHVRKVVAATVVVALLGWFAQHMAEPILSAVTRDEQRK